MEGNMNQDYYTYDSALFIDHLLIKHFFLQHPTMKVPRIQVTGIIKNELTNPYEKVTFLCGVNEEGVTLKFTQSEAIRLIEQKGVEFYILKDKRSMKLEVAVSKFWIKYLKASSDKDEPDTLLSLPVKQH